MKIGIFDSGIGGLALLGYAREMLPGEEFLFYADSDNVPYGTKTKEEIIKLSDDAVSFLVEKGCKAVVIACNTATSAAANFLREKYSIPIIGIEPAVKPAVELDDDKRILVIATPFTVKEKKLHDLIARVDISGRVDMLATPMLVEYAEKGQFDSMDVYSYLEELLDDYDIYDYCSVVLGCTHFIHFKEVISEIFDNRVSIMDGGRATIRNLYRIIKELEDVMNLINGVRTESIPGTTYYKTGKEVTDIAEIKFFEDIVKHAIEVNEIL